MSQPGLGAKNGLICGECGSFNLPEARECWICHGTQWRVQRQDEDHAPLAQGFFSTISGWMILIAGVGLILGLYRLAPGMLIAAVVFVLPPVLIVEVRASRRRRAGRPMSLDDRIGLFMLIAIVLPIVLITALFIAAYIICAFSGP